MGLDSCTLTRRIETSLNQIESPTWWSTKGGQFTRPVIQVDGIRLFDNKIKRKLTKRKDEKRKQKGDKPT